MQRIIFFFAICLSVGALLLPATTLHAQDVPVASKSSVCEVCKAPEDPRASEAYKALEEENRENLSAKMGLSRQLAMEHARPSRGDVVGWTMLGVCTLVAGYGAWQEDWVLTGAAGACMAGGGAMVLVW